jgi:PPOX class probable F420-dependent enzyme
MAESRLSQEGLLELFSSQTLGVLATIKRDGRPQLSNIGYHWDSESGTARIIAAGFRAKTVNLRRDDRASIHVNDPKFSLWLVAEGSATISEPCVTHDDAIADEILSLPGYDQIPRGSDQLEALLRDYPIIGRHIIRVKVDRIYGGESSAARGISFTVNEGTAA